MALDREKTFSNAERLLKQGKTAQALDECKRLAEDAPKDLLMLNRLGDFLARSNRGADAIVYYSMIAEQFSASGFYPKAIAILKKIVRVDPEPLGVGRSPRRAESQAEAAGRGADLAPSGRRRLPARPGIHQGPRSL